MIGLKRGGLSSFGWIPVKLENSHNQNYEYNQYKTAV